MQVKIWNKTDLINDCRPNVIMEAYPFSKTRDMLLFYIGEEVNQVVDIRQVKSTLIENNINVENMTSLQMGQKYLELLESSKEEENKPSLEELKEENEKLKARQDATEEAILSILDM